MNNTPSSERLHIGIFGKRNAGKSSLINAITGQNMAIVSDVKGTTTDPVLKSMELLPLGPVVFIDTPGLDDEGELGDLRVRKAYQMLNKTDVALVVIDGTIGMMAEDKALIQKIQKQNIPYIVAVNKTDVDAKQEDDIENQAHVRVSALTGEGIYELKEKLAYLAKQEGSEKKIVGDLLNPLDVVVLVVPIDASAPKGRLILPQQQTIRDILDAGAISIVVKDTELEETLQSLHTEPKLVITDSQIFGTVSKIVPTHISLTSFSILMARYKGDLKEVVTGAHAIDKLQDGDTVLVSEGCTHHRQCEDIGTVKLPNWIREYTERNVQFEFTSGVEFPDDLSRYKMVIHCGGCMLNEREMKHRLECAKHQDVPMTNYGTVIAHMKGILKRSLEIFGE